MTLQTMIEKMVEQALKKQAAKTVVGEGMKVAGMNDIKNLLGMFGVTPTVMEKAIMVAVNALEVWTAQKQGLPIPGPTPGLGPGMIHPAPPEPRPIQTVTKVDISPEATFNRHMGLLKFMVNAYGDVPLSEALKRLDAEKADVIAALSGQTPQGKPAATQEVPPAAPAAVSSPAPG